MIPVTFELSHANSRASSPIGMGRSSDRSAITWAGIRSNSRAAATNAGRCENAIRCRSIQASLARPSASRCDAAPARRWALVSTATRGMISQFPQYL